MHAGSQENARKAPQDDIKENSDHTDFSENETARQAGAALNSARAKKTSQGRKSASAFRTISEVANSLGVQQHVLRFWETKFSQVKPLKRGGGRRYYRPEDVDLLEAIHHLLYVEGYTIKGVQKLLRDVGKKKIIKNFSGSALKKREEAQQETHPKTEAVESRGTGTLNPQQRNALESVLRELKELRGMIKRP